MADDIQSKITAVKQAYGNSPAWVKKVEQMSEGQLVAVYLRLKSNNKI